ncbi:MULTISPECIES: hypothetical protein [unclassified Brenneria]|uniref:hypothetical protein n=1 Tax=unclassified Brenneria TaxID=2634434 RepID=UPI0029C3F19C|nr:MULTISPECIES: hypothetical protein [unclassified Brenneria]MDX5627316.1 hypothetical protein [Brenneria sp. L3-3Z]MDX5694528.1 hypothetical protein [Brenneria sp. L4-2C]
MKERADIMLAGARWGEIDRDAGTWTIPSGRRRGGGAGHVITLTPPVLALLTGLENHTLQSAQSRPSMWLFAGLDDNNQPVDARSILLAHAQVFGPQSAYLPLRVRLLFSVLAEYQGFSADTIAYTLSSTDPATQCRYFVLPTGRHRALMEWWGNYLKQQPARRATVATYD